MTKNLDKVVASLRDINSKKYKSDYFIPSVWLEQNKPELNQLFNIKPTKFFLQQIKQIYQLSKNKIVLPDNWTNHSIIYNLFIRYATAFDHNQDGVININPENQFNELGTFLKAIALLPYLYNLGVNTIYLLPITSIGIDGRKGNLGSPYAIKNPYKLDENLNEAILGLDIETQFAAFVEAAHLIGMKVVVEFVFRTASKDSDLALDNPDWFYWIKDKIKNREPNSNDENKYGNPIFTEKQLEEIKKKIQNKDFQQLPTPSETYKNMFTEIPKKVARVDGRIVGVLGEINKCSCKIPGAFADWPPDDIQPPWSDVTYLRLYNHPAFNYIAYNTIRMYDQRLNEKYKIESLWQNIINIIPYYQNNFNIDGVMIDMGHALPSALRTEIIDTARENNPHFVFWEENFELTKKSLRDGYNVSLGYMPFDSHLNYKVKEFVQMLSGEGTPIPFFGTAETHNTHRTASRNGDIEFSKFTWTLFNFLPSLPFILNGFELGESHPINTGLCFEQDEIDNYSPETLPLFSLSQLDWNSKNNIYNFIQNTIEIRNKTINLEDNFNSKTLTYVNNQDQWIIAFIRKFEKNNFLFVGNMFNDKKRWFSLKLSEKFNSFEDLLSNKNYFLANGWLIAELMPYEFIFGKLE